MTTPVEPFALDAADAFPDLPGVLGPCEVARAFTDVWDRGGHGPGRLAMQQRIYRATTATPPTAVPGRMRSFEPGDREVVVRWLRAFVDEAMPDVAVHEDPGRLLDRRLDDPDGDFFVWEHDGLAVSLAGYGTPTPNGIRVGPVYTPPEHRRNGYASALVGGMTAALLERRRFCFLFTDRANPTSNAIYRRIGYEPVGDVDQYRFA
jgi:predicted GNAT family acetyltransferase